MGRIDYRIMHVDIDGIKINYIDEGSGKTVLLLHGWGGSIQTMNPIANFLKDKCRVIALDLPGFGESGIPDTPWNSYNYAECIKKFIDKLQLSEIILFGHSHGGRISIILAGKYDLVKKLILIDSAGIIPKRKLNYYVKVYSFKLLKKLYMIFSAGDSKEQRAEKFYKRFGSEDYKSAHGIMRQTMVKVINDNLINVLPSINAPTLLIWGENDEDTPIYMGKLMEDRIADSGLVVLEGAGHYSYIDCYDRFKAVINVFLKDEFK
ncbi:MULTISPECIES: alpha/beta fold hydrolase [unclassified Sedimentibacter]|uniref:alpha/beta fold hydrolase n=1 Tax=unclassified Sedimentibacter TaxID=2649220 RepID=UPI0027DFE72B|nr:alpha/beta hydrolase [Sedimentibacter sp. MB35-C1]WMJ76365.1 alpha/beta hydrolase [Sedimentibacter sp. MB35-C1]